MRIFRAEDLAQLEEHLFCSHKALGSIFRPTLIRCGGTSLWLYTQGMKTGRERVQDHFQLYNEFKTGLGYRRSVSQHFFTDELKTLWSAACFSLNPLWVIRYILMMQWRVIAWCVQFVEHLRFSHWSESYPFVPCFLEVMKKVGHMVQSHRTLEEKIIICPIYNFLFLSPKRKIAFKMSAIPDCIGFQFNISSG